MTAIRYQAITSAKDEQGNLTYNGKTYGVRFEGGKAYFDDVTVDKKLGLTADEIAQKMEKDFGYEILRLNFDGTPYMDDVTLAGATNTSPVLPLRPARKATRD